MARLVGQTQRAEAVSSLQRVWVQFQRPDLVKRVFKHVQTWYHPQTNVQTDLLKVRNENCVFQMSKIMLGLHLCNQS